MRRIISVLLENEAGALSRVIGLFAQRGYNIDTLNVAPTEDPTLSRLTVTTSGDDRKIEQIKLQVSKLIEVVELEELTDDDHVERELMMIKVRTARDTREEVRRTTEIFRGQIIDVTPATYTVQLTGTRDKLDAFVEAMRDIAILEVVRTGVSGIARGENVMAP